MFAQGRGQVRRLNSRFGRDNDAALDGVLQFAHVARPSVTLQHGASRGMMPVTSRWCSRRVLFKEAIPPQRMSVVRSRRVGSTVKVLMAEEQVLPQLLVGQSGVEMKLVAADKRKSDLIGRALPTGGEFALLQHAQKLGLERCRHLADFIQQERASVGSSMTPDRSASAR